jgi:hypothetical protein
MFDPWQDPDLFLCSKTPRSAVRPTGVKRPGREADYAPPSNAEDKNEWSLCVCVCGVHSDSFRLSLSLLQ